MERHLRYMRAPIEQLQGADADWDKMNLMMRVLAAAEKVSEVPARPDRLRSALRRHQRQSGRLHH
jgi:hypothetical protein